MRLEDIKKLVKLASDLDVRGLYKEADALDKILVSLAQVLGEDSDEDMGEDPDDLSSVDEVESTDPKSLGKKHNVIMTSGGYLVFVGSYTKDHIQGHNKPGLGSVFAKDVRMDDIIDIIKNIPDSWFQKNDGIYTAELPGVGYDLVKPVSEIRQYYPNAREVGIEKQEGVVMQADASGNQVPKKGADGRPIPNMVGAKAFILPEGEDGGDWLGTDDLNLIIRPANPMFLPEEVKQHPKLNSAIEAKKAYALLTSFPGSPNPPKTSEWGSNWAVVIPDGGKNMDPRVKEFISASGVKMASKRYQR